MRFLFLLLISFSSFFAHGQPWVVDFLNSAFDAAEVKAAQAQLSYLETKPYKLSPLQKLEFRTQVREMSMEKQEYALRLAPANPWEVKSNNRYFKEYKSYLSIGSQLALKTALRERYLLLSEYIYYAQLKELADEQVHLIEKQLGVLERQSGSSFFDADDYVDLKIQHLDKVADREDAAFEFMNRQVFMNTLYPGLSGKTLVLEEELLIDVENIEKVLDSVKRQELNSLLVTYQQQKLNVDNSRYMLEKNNINLGFFQAEYDERRVEQERVPYTIGLGVTIPITNPNKGDMARQKLNAIETEYELKAAEEDEKISKANSYSLVKEMISQYYALKAKITEMQNSALATHLSQLKGGDPLIRIKYESSINKLRVLELRLKRKVYTYYIDYLAATDYLQHAPLVNYFSNNLRLLGEN